MNDSDVEELKSLVNEMVQMGFLAVTYGYDGTERYQITELGRLEMQFSKNE